MRDTELYRSETARGISAALKDIETNKLNEFIDLIESKDRVFFSGAGRSLLMIKAFAMALMQIGKTVYVTGEVCTPSIQKGDLLIAASCSGETKSLLLFVEEAKKAGAEVALITGRADSSIGKLSDFVLTMGYKPEEGAVSNGWLTDNRFEQSIVPLGDCVMEYIARDNNKTNETIASNHANME